MIYRRRFKRGVPIVGIIRAGHLYQVRLKNGDWLFLSEDERRSLGYLKVGGSLRVRDMERVFMLRKEKTKFLAYERANDHD